MRQAADIRKAISPDQVLFVIDAMIGQDAVDDRAGLPAGRGHHWRGADQLDGDARGGDGPLRCRDHRQAHHVRVHGEKLEEIEVFDPDRMASRILDMGDILTLIEQAEKAFDQDVADRMAAKVTAGEDFTLTDFLAQMQQLKNMGSMKKMLTMLPGMGQMREQIDNFDEREIVRTEAIIQSMTPAERDNPRCSTAHAVRASRAVPACRSPT